MSALAWAVLMPDGLLVEGAGQDAPGGMKLSTIAREALALRFQPRPGLVVYVAGPAELTWTVQSILACGAEGKRMVQAHGIPQVSRALGVEAGLGSRLWMLPGGALGLGRSVEDVERAWGLFAEAEGGGA